MYISVVVPVFNEEGNISKLHKEICDVCKAHSYNFEIIFVNDGSSDKTLHECLGLAPIKIINLRRNFGQTAAMDAGIKAAQGEIIITLDGDGQNDPNDIPALLQHLVIKDLDVVSGWRRKRKDNISKHVSSRLAYLLRQILIKDSIHDSGCSLKAYRRICFKSIDLYGEMHRFIPGILRIKGFRIGEIEVNHRPRTVGATKYNWRRGAKGILDMFSVFFWYRYSSRPLHFFGAMGFISGIIGIFFGIISLGMKISGTDLSNTIEPLLAVFFTLMGIIFLGFGIVSDMLSKTYFSVSKDAPYDIERIIVNTSSNDAVQ